MGDLVDKKNARRYDDCLSYTMVASKKALQQAGLEKGANADGHGALDKSRVGVLVGSGMGGLTGEGRGRRRRSGRLAGAAGRAGGAGGSSPGQACRLDPCEELCCCRLLLLLLLLLLVLLLLATPCLPCLRRLPSHSLLQTRPCLRTPPLPPPLPSPVFHPTCRSVPGWREGAG